MVHHDYNNSRHASLSQINRDTVKNLQLKYMFSIGGRSTGGTLRGKEESTPLVDDGFMYVTDTWSRVMKFDVRSGTSAVPLWRYDPKIARSRTTRGLAMYGNKIFLSTYDARLIALDRDSGEVAWEVQAAAPMDPKTGTPSKTQAFSGAPLAIKSAGGKDLVIQGESTGGSQGTRSWIGAFEADTGKLVWRTFTIPAPGEPGSETWKDNHNAYRIGGASVWQTASYDPATNLLYFGTGDAFPTFDPEYRPGDNLYHREHDRARRRYRADGVVFPGDAERALGLRHAEPEDALRRQSSTASRARSSPTSRATASSTRSIARAASSCAPTSTRRR